MFKNRKNHKSKLLVVIEFYCVTKSHLWTIGSIAWGAMDGGALETTSWALSGEIWKGLPATVVLELTGGTSAHLNQCKTN